MPPDDAKNALIRTLETTLLGMSAADRKDPLRIATILVEAGWTIPPTTTPRQSSAPGTFWLHWNSTTVAADVLETEAKRRRFVLLNAWEGALARTLKAINPKLTVLVYKDASSTRSYDTKNSAAQVPAGLTYAWADANRPDWFLLDRQGRRLQYSNYSGHWQMDVGNAAYRETWAANVIAGSKGIFDGVLIDNLLWQGDDYHANVYPKKYPTDEALRSAYAGFLGVVGTRLRAAGLTVYGNLTNARVHPGGWAQYMAYLDGAWDEWWLALSDTNLLSDYAEGWRAQTNEILANEKAGKATLVQPHHSFGSAGDPAFRYALASYLMVAGPRSAITGIEKTDAYGPPSPWRDEYGWDLGTPLGSYTEIARGVFRRDFEQGATIVNANPRGSSPVVIELDSVYTAEMGNRVTRVSLSGVTGTILRKSP